MSRILEGADEVLIVLIVGYDCGLSLVKLAGDLVEVSTLNKTALRRVAVDLDAILLVPLSRLIDKTFLSLLIFV